MAPRGPDGGPLVPVRIEPEDFHAVAQSFVDASSRLYQVLPTLFRVLDGFRGPAGMDQAAKQFDASYRPAVETLVNGVNRAVNLLGDIGVGIDTSARNHWNADAAATPGRAGQPPPFSPANPGLVLPQDPAVPSLVGSPTAVLPPPLDDKIPMGHTDDLRTVGRAFWSARDTIEGISVGQRNALQRLFSNNQAADLDALNAFWDRVGGSGNTAILTALQRGCDELGNAVSQFADWIEDTQNRIVDAIGNAPKDAALGAIAAILLGMITEGLGAIAGIAKVLDEAGEGAILVTAVDGVLAVAGGRLVAVGAVAGSAVGAMTAAINSTPDPNIGQTNPQSVTDAQAQAAAKDVADQAAKPADVGAARELKVAELTDGTVPSGAPGTPGRLIVRPGVGKTDIDVIGGDGSYIQVGGPAKARDLAKLGQKLNILKWKAGQDGVGAQAFFEEGTPENVLAIARRILGPDNVHTFTP
ncbi:hypothetical protein [Gandjariella thermophila]|uniref:Uncharacterized protein n=1 Tax=Gandjariella thermophila TaxID=1931992 RepID=A0A4D4JJ98_9PSEU|nr:hypothetical protein [Gandjariella thermophila]GDY33987.1 hypothetical protein GTS_56200 [Gandjariella thermophila]